MAYSYKNIIWHYGLDYAPRYGIVNVGGYKWSVVVDDYSTPRLAVRTLTTVTGRDTALGFIKLLLEK